VAVGFLAAAIVLFLAFGSLTSMLLPLLTAGFGLGIGVGMIGVLTHAMPISNVAPSLSLLIGLGVGVDYALFTVTRYRRGLLSGLAPRDAAVAAMNTSGRAVVFAGATVCVALLGMLVLGLAYLNGMAVAAALTVLFTVLAASTLLPALLGILRMRVLSRRVRRRLAEQGPVPQESGRGFWARWAEFVARRPATLAVAALVVLAVLAVPFASLHEGHADDGTLPTSMTSRKAYDQLAEGFGPGFNGPLLLVAQLGSASDGSVDYPRLVSAVERTPGVASVKQLQLGAGLGVLEVFPASAPDASGTDALIQNLRGQVIPAAESGGTMAVYVTGMTAVFYDFSHVLSQKLPLFVGTIVLLGLLLLLLAFRSVAVPLTAAVMNLLGAAASFGVVVAIFQWGWGMNALGLGSPAPIDPFIPVIMFSILFGLSMDYQVFLTSRIHEEWLRTGENRTAVNTAQAQTGRVITAAAAIMICVFFAFALGGQHIIAEFGIGLVAAVLIDAFLVRSVLVPALMHLLGRANWWLPSGLDRLLPHLAIEAAEASAAAGPAATKPASPAASNGDLVGAVDE
jgi:RND superfamily putative drug exporter